AKQLARARADFKALTKHTMDIHEALKHLSDILQVNRSLNLTYLKIDNNLNEIDISINNIEQQLSNSKQKLLDDNPPANVHAGFLGVLFSFSRDFKQKIRGFQAELILYVQARETESWFANQYHTALKKRQLIKEKLSEQLGMISTQQAHASELVVDELDFANIDARYRSASQSLTHHTKRVNDFLNDIKMMCEMVTHPSLRERPEGLVNYNKAPYEDLHSRYTHAVEEFPFIAERKENLLHVFRLFQHSHNMFLDDLYNLNNSLASIVGDSDAYFQTKSDYSHIRDVVLKSRMLESLIDFLQIASLLLNQMENLNYSNFTKALSKLIDTADSPWFEIQQGLISSKINAEAQL
ncbi:MAG: hypothetical protein ACC635_05280, partial [Acidiferrobacterales bacterium]